MSNDRISKEYFEDNLSRFTVPDGNPQQLPELNCAPMVHRPPFKAIQDKLNAGNKIVDVWDRYSPVVRTAGGLRTDTTRSISAMATCNSETKLPKSSWMSCQLVDRGTATHSINVRRDMPNVQVRCPDLPTEPLTWSKGCQNRLLCGQRHIMKNAPPKLQ